MTWITPEELLPEAGTDLLVCTDTYYIGIGWYYHDQQKWGFEIEKLTDVDLGNVTHWMPLPAPPDVFK